MKSGFMFWFLLEIILGISGLQYLTFTVSLNPQLMQNTKKMQYYCSWFSVKPNKSSCVDVSTSSMFYVVLLQYCGCCIILWKVFTL